MDTIILEKLEQLRKLYPDEESTLIAAGWEKQLKHSSLFIDLKNHAAFKIICDGYYKELMAINEELKTNESLFKGEEGVYLGRLLHERRRFIQTFFRPFELAKVEKASVDENINKKISEAQS